jgi:hypothetical protein
MQQWRASEWLKHYVASPEQPVYDFYYHPEHYDNAAKHSASSGFSHRGKQRRERTEHSASSNP